LDGRNQRTSAEPLSSNAPKSRIAFVNIASNQVVALIQISKFKLICLLLASRTMVDTSRRL